MTDEGTRSELSAVDGTLVEVAARRELASGILEVTLRAADGGDLPPWSAGAHIELLLPNGLIRQYSLCGDPYDLRVRRIAVLKEPMSRGGSSYVHEALLESDRLIARGPRNHFPLLPASNYVFLAGGIGITPLIPMIDEAHRSGASFAITYCGRRRDSMGYLPELIERFGDVLNVHASDENGRGCGVGGGSQK